ncbi:hypothetical protein LCGC14_0907410 [marine sediment metagenome]|uniref:LamG-like jellyroll fold domain-containing protein n=1 Tax=marine sediment metagenome TaxID=412755 RepID=A0A0F9S1I3_9ZZZZ
MPKTRLSDGLSIDQFIPPQLRYMFYKNPTATAKYRIGDGLDPYGFSTNGLALYLPLWALNNGGTNSIQSVDAYKHTATITGALWHPQGRLFDNVDDKLVIPHNAGLNAVGQCTIIAWIRPTNTWQTGTNHQILDKRSDAGGIAPTLLWSDAVDNIAMFAGTNCAIGTTASFAAGTWFMMAGMAVDGVVGGAGNKIWVNGVDETSTTGTATFVINTVDLIIGAVFADPAYANFLDADIGELWFYPTRAFTDAETLDHHNKTAWRYQ